MKHLIVATVLVAFLGGWAHAAKGLKVGPREVVQKERPKRWAILIGVDRYEDETGIGSLKYCAADMKLLHRVLTGPGGGFDPKNVLLMTRESERLHRPTYSNIMNMLHVWLADVKADDDVLVAFSGHGITRDRQVYLLPSDAKYATLGWTSVKLSYVRDKLAECKARRKILILDACHSGAGKASAKMSPDFLKALGQGKGFVRLASCGEKQKSNEDAALVSKVGKGHGVFTYYLAEGLLGKADRDQDGRIDVDEAYRYANQATRAWARARGVRQDPWKFSRMTGEMTVAYRVSDLPGLDMTEWDRRLALAGKADKAFEFCKRMDASSSLRAGQKAENWRNYIHDFGATGFEMAHARERSAYWRDVPSDWNTETKRVKVATPKGKIEKDIVYYTNTLGMKFVKIPAGAFMMGSPVADKYRSSHEGPVHKVRISESFYMGAHEVTQAAYEKVMGRNPAHSKGTNNPVERVSWKDAVEFCKRLTQKEGPAYRLPTEAEWEYACRGGSRTRYYSGDAGSGLSDIAWCSSNCGGKPHPVGSKTPNAFGLYDMSGNVWEWCQSLPKPYPYRKDDGRESMTASGSRMLRGGSWKVWGAKYCRSAERTMFVPSITDAADGFRVVVELSPRP